MEKPKGDKIYELRKKIQALEWDIKYNKLPQERIHYYNRLVEEYNALCGEGSVKFEPMSFEDKKI